jgi:hypothetical protein
MEKEDKSAVTYSDMISQKLNYRTQFYNQSASMIPIGSWMNTEIGGSQQVPLTFHVAVAPFPKDKDGDPTGVAPVTADYIAVAEKSQHKQEAYDFIRWYTTQGLSKYGKNIPSWNGVKSEEMAAIVDKAVAGKYLEVANGSTADGGMVSEYTSTGCSCQKWQFVPTDNGYYHIVNVNSGKYLEVQNGYVNDDRIIQQWSNTSGENQEWRVVDRGTGYIQLFNRKSGKTFDIHGSTDSQPQELQYQDTGDSSQQWQLVSAP